MPQMAPILWYPLFMMILFLIVLIMSEMYFQICLGDTVKKKKFFFSLYSWLW
uniref:ATP synthase F0 subunit 8 n=1 Tax=Jesogammarus hinumensis TaxID=378308 RepID=A0A891ZKI2_9CRUS|nr:ATP synthase F0 subunit 8 [Jesogammarus hinumensis]QRN71579.1 ATP synthase F0 subunit 8 [Jesogammarus hinumensis]